MAGLIAGGGSGAVASSAHAGCTRFRLTDPMLTGRSRRSLAAHLGHPDVSGAIPVARWVRAMAFERMVHDEGFVSELLTRAVGLLGLARPEGVRVRSAHDSVVTTASELAAAHLAAKHAGEATMLFGLRLPFLMLEGRARATDVRPDFAIIAPRVSEGTYVGSWLVMGDAKDYERVRSRIDDGRMLKGFLQVALGAESAAAWSALPAGMEVHGFGALAVPRNAYLRPEAVVEDLADHRVEVRSRVEERIAALDQLGDDVLADDVLGDHVAHLEATYDPATCSTCSLFRYCRTELRSSSDAASVLVEIGVPRAHRAGLLGLVDGTGVAPPSSVPTSVVAQVEATTTGRAQSTGRRRVDAVGQPGTVYVVVVKSDSAALGVHGVAVQRVDGNAGAPWEHRVFARTNATETRHEVMGLLGAAVRAVMDDGHGPVHVVVPDQPTADLLVSMADSLAGVELSRLRWQRDIEEGREPLTFDGEPATLPHPLGADARLAVSLLLEEDRARAFGLRQPVVDLRRVLSSYLVAGGPTYDAGRLDYLLAWAEATSPVDHREVSDRIADGAPTPGARLSKGVSDRMHETGRPEGGDARRYTALVEQALEYRIDIVLRTVAVLDDLLDSRLRPAYRTLEGDAQVVWGRRLALEASDLVRFSRTYRYWRNAQVDMLDADRACLDQLAVLVDRQTAWDKATNAGVRELALAEVVDTSPLRLRVRSRRFATGTQIVLLHSDSGAAAEAAGTSLKIQATSFKLGGLAVGPLEGPTDPDDPTGAFVWQPKVVPALSVGETVLIADVDWLGGGFKSGHEIAVRRPSSDSIAAPKATCEPSSYATDPAGHAWCCKPHAIAEADWSDTLAERRAAGELNPQAWPPVVDTEQFDPASGDDGTGSVPPQEAPEGLTLDDVE